ncbi:hypothetical protein MVLG_03746 [Microbotryum lychnidis-dioicae p1A1 Lamole]|nr:hypothetical protein MVLG_03746 [Microbotryum lychnidis-dioicae p1A1 Lamole]|eukprot:KDE05934.1 hypothetical protein MVLG_03746 [Microbotryum lychnidis-dioicae p1A1 Lamole]
MPSYISSYVASYTMPSRTGRFSPLSVSGCCSLSGIRSRRGMTLSEVAPDLALTRSSPKKRLMGSGRWLTQQLLSSATTENFGRRNRSFPGGMAQKWWTKGWAERRSKGDKLAREVVWVWVDADQWMGWLKGMYLVNWGKRPGIVVSDPKELAYWNRDLSFEPITSDTVYETIEQGILTNRLKPLSSRSLFDRLAHRLALLTDSSFKSYFSSHPFALVFFIISSWVAGW